jgi:hypothetical protein
LGRDGHKERKKHTKKIFFEREKYSQKKKEEQLAK